MIKDKIVNSFYQRKVSSIEEVMEYPVSTERRCMKMEDSTMEKSEKQLAAKNIGVDSC